MLLTIQFPIADCRQFLADNTGFLNVPPWGYSLDPQRDFVRSFGKIEKRRLKGLKNWIGESTICFARKALRFPEPGALQFIYNGGQNSIPLRVVFRRFFSDGYATGKFEVGIGSRHDNPVNLNAVQTGEFINHCLSMKVHVPYSDGTLALAEAGKAVANLYLKASTKRKELKTLQPQKWWVEAGKPLLFLVYSEAEQIKIPFETTELTKLNPQTNPYDLAFCEVEWQREKNANKWKYGMWLIKFPGDIDYKSVRELRIALLRLYAERQCVRSVLRNIGRGNLVIPQKSVIDELNPNAANKLQLRKNQASDTFQRYWKTAVNRIKSYERAANIAADALPEEDEISKMARNAEDVIEPGERQEILSGLEHIRPNYQRTVETFIYQDIENQQNNTFSGGNQTGVTISQTGTAATHYTEQNAGNPDK